MSTRGWKKNEIVFEYDCPFLDNVIYDVAFEFKYHSVLLESKYNSAKLGVAHEQ
jgi:hypothetical protein